MANEAEDPLLQYATETQARHYRAYKEHGSFRAAARALGLNYSAVRSSVALLEKKAARLGHAPGHFENGVAPGYLMGKVTVHRDAAGAVVQTWERQSPAEQEREEYVRDFVAGLVDEMRGALGPSATPTEAAMADLLAVYAFGDPHFGLRALADEAGEDFDLAECDRLTRAGIDRLVASTPPAEHALLLNIGDNTHADNSKNQTPGHGNQVDVDGRHFNVVQVSARAWAYAIRRVLTKHERVTVWMVPGNHDPETSFAIALALSMLFESEPRVTVDLSPSLYRFMRFGKVLIGAHHGHGAKPGDLPLLMAVDRPKDWGESEFRYVWVGHIHHDTVKEVQGVRVESLRTLAAKDAWHAGKGYRSMRDTRVVVYHAEGGEEERHTCSVARLRKAA
jgi:hypothetical protein